MDDDGNGNNNQRNSPFTGARHKVGVCRSAVGRTLTGHVYQVKARHPLEFGMTARKIHKMNANGSSSAEMEEARARE